MIILIGVLQGLLSVKYDIAQCIGSFSGAVRYHGYIHEHNVVKCRKCLHVLAEPWHIVHA
jgi:hypothetical protein